MRGMQDEIEKKRAIYEEGKKKLAEKENAKGKKGKKGKQEQGEKPVSAAERPEGRQKNQPKERAQTARPSGRDFKNVFSGAVVVPEQVPDTCIDLVGQKTLTVDRLSEIIQEK